MAVTQFRLLSIRILQQHNNQRPFLDRSSFDATFSLSLFGRCMPVESKESVSMVRTYVVCFPCYHRRLTHFSQTDRSRVEVTRTTLDALFSLLRITSRPCTFSKKIRKWSLNRASNLPHSTRPCPMKTIWQSIPFYGNTCLHQSFMQRTNSQQILRTCWWLRSGIPKAMNLQLKA